MKVLLVAAVVALIHGIAATLLIKGPSEPVLEGEHVTLECLYSDSELNISQVHFEVFSQYMQRWRTIWSGSWCFASMSTERTADSLVLFIPHAAVNNDGSYRCVSDGENGTAADMISPLLDFKVHYMRELSLTREGYRSYLGVPQELKVRLGDDVVLECDASSSEEPDFSWSRDGDDWILPSSTLTLRKISAMDEGHYTCMAEHPSVEALRRNRTISITVLSKDARWYESSNARFMLMTSAAAFSLLMLTFVVSASLFLFCRARRAAAFKGPIDDHYQKKPIYKTSVESLPSICADKQPLV
ncbi:Cell surface glycoprotein MUC18 [Liparis tanakae]|uniref:Cell surface glycoprotein MUC18 n=1 Tax=Liparis tanakae TaxID=230148 RepID=A0A4Z2JHE6_9TELE|nr:Cell surface glycoprotein MUC18 [Liparis tanakae]